MAIILVLDDDLSLLRLVSMLLRSDGHTIIETSDPLDALAMVIERKQGIDLIVTDVTVKPMTGLEFATRLVERGIDIPVLFMSGYHAVAAGLGSAFLQKPFTAPELRSAVKSALGTSGRTYTCIREVAAQMQSRV